MLVLTRKAGQEIVFIKNGEKINLRVIALDERNQKANFQIIEDTQQENSGDHGTS